MAASSLALINSLPVEIQNNEHILNFYDESKELVIPEWLPKSGLKLIMGAGDLDQGDELNVVTFKDYDVFYCGPWDNNGSLLKNINYLIENYNKKKLICFIDNSNDAHVEKFINVFKGHFSFIDGFGGHCPHFPLPALDALLQVGGKAANIFEGSETFVTDTRLIKMLEINLVTRETLARIHYTDKANEPIIKTLLIKTINNISTPIQVKIELESGSLENEPINWLQYILYSVYLCKFISPTIQCSYIKFTKPWKTKEELVLTKITDYDSLYSKINKYKERIGSEDVHYRRCKATLDGFSTYPAYTSSIDHTMLATRRNFYADSIKIINAAVGGRRRSRKNKSNKRNTHRKFRNQQKRLI